MTTENPSPLALAFEPFKLAVKWAIIFSTLWMTSCAIQGFWLHARHLRTDHIEHVLAEYLTDAPALVSQVADKTWSMISKIRIQRAHTAKDSEKLSDTLGRVAQLGIPSMMDIVALNTVLVVVKLCMAWFYMGLYALILSLAAIDGLVARYIRKVSAGHESATLYHFAKFWGSRLLPLTALSIYLCWPEAIDVHYVMLPALVAHGLLLRTQLKYYKKYV
jgi:hypothetical protein